MQLPDEFNALMQVLYTSEAYRVSQRLSLLARHFYVFERNYRDLEQILTKASSADSHFSIWLNPDVSKVPDLLNEVNRLFHNYLASAKTLVDHTRSLIRRWYADTDFLALYQTEIVRRFESNPSVGFVEGLRNYALHFPIPLAVGSIEVNYNPDGSFQSVESKCYLSKSALLLWGKWPTKAKEYLAITTDSMDLDSLAAQYYNTVTDFHNWLHASLRSRHASELTWLEDQWKRLDQLRPKYK